jgi:hypothetical protein
MTPDSFARYLGTREHHQEITLQEQDTAKAANLVVMFHHRYGYTDCTVCRGAIDATIRFSKINDKGEYVVTTTQKEPSFDSYIKALVAQVRL